MEEVDRREPNYPYLFPDKRFTRADHRPLKAASVFG
jgi:hypothetical protein